MEKYLKPERLDTPHCEVRIHTPEYTVPEHVRKDYNCKLQTSPEKELGPSRGLIHLMAIVQHNKGKVWPVMDYRELNDPVEGHSVRADVCSQNWETGVGRGPTCRCWT